MNYFGKSIMKKNNNYEIAKGELAEYISDMEATYKYHKDMIKECEEDESLLDVYELEEGKKFVKTWDIIKNVLSVDEKNLLLLHQIYIKPQKTLEVFNGMGNSVKNKATIARKIWIIKEKIKKAYE